MSYQRQNVVRKGLVQVDNEDLPLRCAACGKFRKPDNLDSFHTPDTHFGGEDNWFECKAHRIGALLKKARDEYYEKK